MRFQRDGLQFEYPDDWSIDVDADADGVAEVTALSPEGGFWSVSVHPSSADPLQLTRAIVDEMRRQYDDIDVEPAGESIEGRELRGHDFNFYCLDLTNTATVRAIRSPAAIHLVLCQAEDREWKRVAPVFSAMTTSLVRGLPRG